MYAHNIILGYQVDTLFDNTLVALIGLLVNYVAT